ncbi:hypothetical protein QBC41DRAFT_262075 [Cercophora samala]|uniref:Zn(2)-C6 fungal-type domain-containing protein n=1 Tax=Cercophora samala TaxID=330535 RepID=A0AA40D297_9PEZI|nr:hypothetical protein QBC41DRAFT_262075 [Cercophora samala]
MAPSASPSHTPGPQAVIPFPSNQKRASTPKVRTGCITCKNRHVKCDERKPKCSRCEKARMECHGYLAKTDQKTTRKSNKSATIRGGPRPLQMIRPARVAPFCPQKDIIYYEFFRYTLVNDLAGYLHADFWSRIVLCEGIRDHCVNHAIFAIGALSQALFADASLDESLARHSTSSPPSPTTPSQLRRHHVLNPHYRLAIHHQNQAISLCLQRTRDNEDAMSSRNLLVVTLLLVSYEILQGDMEAADGLMSSGIRLLHDSLTTLRDNNSRHSLSSGSVDQKVEDTEDMEYILPFLIGNSKMDPLASNDLPVLGKTSTVKYAFLWQTFHTRCLLFITQAMQRTFSGQALSTAGESHSLVLEQTQLWNTSRQWQKILSEYKAAVSPEDLQARKIILLLLLQCYTDLICLTWSLDPTGIALDNCESDFGQLVNIAHEVLDDTEPMFAKGFIFSGGNAVGPLILVATKCRTNRRLRWQALEVFRKLSWREGSWDAKVFVSIAGLVMLEEAARDEKGRIDPVNRWVCTGIHSVVDNMKVLGEYTRVLPDDKGDSTKKYLILDLDRWRLADGEGITDPCQAKVDLEVGGGGNPDGLDLDVGGSINGGLSPASAVTGTSDFDSPSPAPTECTSNWDGLSSRDDCVMLSSDFMGLGDE